MEREFQLDLSPLSSEMQLLLSLLQQVNKDDAGEEEIRLPAVIDWDHFLELTKHHRVFPEVYLQMKRRNVPAPPYIVQSLQMEYKKNMFRMFSLMSEMNQICSRFAEQGIRTLFLKGPMLGMELYRDISRRTSADLDILVPFDDLERAGGCLAGLGYLKDDYIDTYLNDWKWRYHHVNYVHSSKQIKIEVHWRLHPGPAKEPGFEQLWKRRKQISEMNILGDRLGDEDLFLFLVAHGARHGWSRLRWLTDIDRFCQKPELHWEIVTARSKQFWIDHLVGQALWLVGNLLHTPKTGEMNFFLRRKRSLKLADEAIFYLSRMVNLHTPPVPEDVSVYHKRHLFTLMNAKQKCMFLLSTLLPVSAEAKLLPLPKALHFLYIPLRPLLWMWRRTKQFASTSAGGTP